MVVVSGPKNIWSHQSQRNSQGNSEAQVGICATNLFTAIVVAQFEHHTIHKVLAKQTSEAINACARETIHQIGASTACQ
jgi:hypothetical protein